MDIRTIFLQQLYLTTYLPTYLPTYLSQLVGRPTNPLTDRSTSRPTSQSIYIHIHLYITSFTAGSIVDKSMKEKNMLLLEKPVSILLKDKNTEQKMILLIEKLAITLYGLLESLVPFSKMMVRQRIRTNYCLKDLVTF